MAEIIDYVKNSEKKFGLKNTSELKKDFEKALGESKNLYFTSSGHGAVRDAYISGIYSLYYNMFGKYPYEFELTQFILPNDVLGEATSANDFKFAKQYLTKYDKYHTIDYVNTLYEIEKAFDGYCYITSFCGITMFILNQYIVYWNQESSFSVLCPNFKRIDTSFRKIKTKNIHKLNFMYSGDVWNDYFNINDYLVYTAKKKEKAVPHYFFMIHTGSGYSTTSLPLKDKVVINIRENYNDDLPYDKITDFLTSPNESGILCFHGVPGSGKTTFIRHLISNVKKDFIIVNESCLASMDDPSLLKQFIDHKNAIIILEDCERVLTERSQGNGLIGTLLNLSDGILSDAFNLKFICTFNANIGNIDKALLRKGRMKVNYEFGKLCTEKSKALAEKLGKDIEVTEPMTLADIYNCDEKVDFTPEKKPSLGFHNRK